MAATKTKKAKQIAKKNAGISFDVDVIVTPKSKTPTAEELDLAGACKVMIDHYITTRLMTDMLMMIKTYDPGSVSAPKT